MMAGRYNRYMYEPHYKSTLRSGNLLVSLCKFPTTAEIHGVDQDLVAPVDDHRRSPLLTAII